ncbi:MAG: exodeoxyribonuclease V subunit alpha [Actinobacteria bacterium]|nr:exodeoxyribonuclease V subunit alpha [Actinomycetota bacterium]
MSRLVTDVPAEAAVLAPFVDAGVFGPSEVQLVAAVSRLRLPDGGSLSVEESLALAVAARAPRLGHVCVELDQVARRIVRPDAAGDAEDDELPWPDPETWAAALGVSDLVQLAGEPVDGPLRPLVWDGTRLYLHRFEAYERAVADDLARRADGTVPAMPGVELLGLFPLPADGGPDRQRRAAEVALANPVSVIAGGPGTGKTRTVARLLAAALAAPDTPIREFALCAPTGKAAARMTEAVHAAVAETEAAGIVDGAVARRLREAEATTIHRLLGARPGAGFARNRTSRLTHDLVIVDETSMVDLPLMAHLLDAVRPEARIVLVGDPEQLASVEAGTVLADLVGPLRSGGGDDAGPGPLAGRVTVLDRVHRFAATSGIAELADAVRTGEADRALSLLDGSRPDLQLVAPSGPTSDDVLDLLVDAGVGVVEAARIGDDAEALRRAAAVKVLAATHRGVNGRFEWEQRIERGVLDRVGDVDRRGRWYVGRPVLVTANDRLNRVFNGDTGVAVATDDGLLVALPDPREPSGIRRVAPARLHEVDTWWSMTIHKSQGSEFPHVVVALPPTIDSPVLTRELLYTAVTRAREQVTIVATEETVRAAVSRPIARASGLAHRLWP